MQSLYAKYLTERTNDLIIETEQGFATYRFINKTQVYIIDIYVLPEFRKQGYAAKLADLICECAKASGCNELIGSVNLNCKRANESILTLIAYGMKAFSSIDNAVIFRKDI
jgi:GNAT superfamily N-acetyltransferase